MAERCHIFPKYWELSSKSWPVPVARSKHWQRPTQRCLVLFLRVRSVGWLSSKRQHFLQNGNNKILSRKHPNAFSFWPLWNLLKSSSWKTEAHQAWVCVFIGTSQLLRTKKYKKALGSVLGGGNSRWMGCCFEPSLTVLQKKLDGKFVFPATKEKMHCFVLPVLCSNFTIVRQVNSSWSWLF